MDGKRYEIIEMLKKRLKSIKKEQKNVKKVIVEPPSQYQFLNIAARVRRKASSAFVYPASNEKAKPIRFHRISGDFLFVENHPASPYFGMIGTLNYCKNFVEVFTDVKENLIGIKLDSIYERNPEELESLFQRLKSSKCPSEVKMGEHLKDYEKTLESLKNEFREANSKDALMCFEEFQVSQQRFKEKNREDFRAMKLTRVISKSSEDLGSFLLDCLKIYEDKRVIVGVYNSDWTTLESDLCYAFFSKAIWSDLKYDIRLLKLNILKQGIPEIIVNFDYHHYITTMTTNRIGKNAYREFVLDFVDIDGLANTFIQTTIEYISAIHLGKAYVMQVRVYEKIKDKCEISFLEEVNKVSLERSLVRRNDFGPEKLQFFRSFYPKELTEKK